MEAKLILIALLLAGMVVLSTQIPQLGNPGYRRIHDLDDEIPHNRVAIDKRERRPSWGGFGGGKIYLGNEDIIIPRSSCIPVGEIGCEANNGKCCRKGNPYTGEMRKCVNTGSFSSPEYTCVEAE